MCEFSDKKTVTTNNDSTLPIIGKRKRLTAKTIRILTLPTILFFAVISILCAVKTEEFCSLQSVLIPIICIGVFPIIAYPLSWFTVDNGDKRKIQRTLAFIFSGIGYTAAFVLALSLGISNEAKLLTTTYFLSFAILLIFNLTGLRASGHACGTAGPLIFLCCRIGVVWLPPCIAIYLLSMWASLTLKRHTLKEYLLGSISSIIAFFIALVFI